MAIKSQNYKTLLMEDKLMNEETRTRQDIQMEIRTHQENIVASKEAILNLERENSLLCDDVQWFTEKTETVTVKDGRKKRKEDWLIGRVHWNQDFKDESTGKFITVERSETVRINGEWNW